MTDPVTNLDIEDVLSSIRRLVSDSDRGAERRAPEPPAPPAKAAEPAVAARDRFVLAPAFRVADPALDLPPEAAADLPPAGPVDLDDAEAGAEADPDEVAEAAVLAEAEAGRPEIAGAAAILEAAVTFEDAEFEPDGSEEVPVMDWSAAQPEDAPVFRARGLATLRLVDAAPPEAPVAEAPPEPADDPAPEPLFQHRPPPESRSGELAEALEDEAEDDDPAFDADLAGFLDGPGTLDEEMLRTLITDIVRSELQGALGERITRNVRKLVRREIYRVLASQEFE